MALAQREQPFSFTLIIAGFVATLVGYASSAAIVFQAAEAAGATPQQIGGWLTALGLAMGISSLGLSIWYRQPILTAWSTPGAAMLATSLHGVTLSQTIGIFLFTNALIVLCGVTGLFARLMKVVPQAITAAMLAGILLRFGLEAFAALQVDLALCGTMCVSWLLARCLLPRYAIIITLLAGLMLALARGDLHIAQPLMTLRWPEAVMPGFSLASLLGVGLPYFLVTMASQNAPGIATLQAHGYQPPVSSLISWTGLIALLLSPFGGFSVCIAAITAAICMSDEAHPDKKRRWIASAIAGLFYLLAGLSGGAVALLLTALPPTLIHTLAGLALLGTLTGSIQRALEQENSRDAAMITFLITASGITLAGIGAAFWGLFAGAVAWRLLSLRRRD
ncbi:MAG: benzoate/H(+) symporter BenE family transporter [Mixta calida]|uniref:benzoate/H(+) symporter BenE family transporter n=1 Tax=Mixta calida TaxID=665913 RepID=UPI00290B4031|nr:benzoate/H(+) symporter BenE family transporter [Mixta calida]MDU4940444.1 benzoate/H(+) symporter BenE family transporter [Mixta calida]